MSENQRRPFRHGKDWYIYTPVGVLLHLNTYDAALMVLDLWDTIGELEAKLALATKKTTRKKRVPAMKVDSE